MMLVDVDRGREDGIALARQLDDMASRDNDEDNEQAHEGADNLSEDVVNDLQSSYSYQRS